MSALALPKRPNDSRLKSRHEKLPLAYPPIRKSSKLGLASICFRQARELAVLRPEVASLRSAVWQPSPPPSTEKIAAREEAKAKLVAEIAAAKLIDAEFVANEEARKPERDRLQNEWETDLREKRRVAQNARQKQYRIKNLEKTRECVRRWQRANPDKVKVYSDRRRQKTAATRLEGLAKKQIRAGVDLLLECAI